MWPVWTRGSERLLSSFLELSFQNTKFKKVRALAARQCLLDMTQRLHPGNRNSTVAETRHPVDTPMWTRGISQGPTLDEETQATDVLNEGE